jgi:hypothetical protein
MVCRERVVKDQHFESKSSNAGFGGAMAAAGGYFILVSFGILPPPGEENPHDPMWIAFCAGLAFFLAGIAVITRAFAGNISPDGQIPPTAPRWVDFTQYGVALAVLACLAAVGTWIALAGDPRKFSVGGPFPDGSHIGEAIARAVFGIGAIVIWLCLLALARDGVRKFFGHDKS